MKYMLSIIAVMLAIPAGAGAADAPEAPRRAAWMSTPCPTEDSVNCYWNHKTMGDGHGRSFYVREVDGKVCRFFVKTKYAAKHDGCRVEN